MVQIRDLTVDTALVGTELFAFQEAAGGAGSTKHVSLTNMLDGTALLAGRAGGQTILGGTQNNDDLELDSTSAASKGFIVIANSASRVILGDLTASSKLHVKSGSFDQARFVRTVAAGGVNFFLSMVMVDKVH